ncbi:MAG: flagellar biosynthetic protein FliO [Planctomycetota bacterium]
MATRYAILLFAFFAFATSLAADGTGDAEPLPEGFGSAPVARENEAPVDEESMTGPMVRAGVGLMVLAIICAGALWFIRRNPKMRKFFAGGEAFKMLGRTFIGGKTSVILLKVGPRVLVVGNAPGGIQLLSEITDATEVSLLLLELQGESEGSSKAEFKDAITAMLSSSSKPRKRRNPISTKLPDENVSMPATEDRLAAIRQEISRLTGDSQ